MDMKKRVSLELRHRAPADVSRGRLLCAAGRLAVEGGRKGGRRRAPELPDLRSSPLWRRRRRRRRRRRAASTWAPEQEEQASVRVSEIQIESVFKKMLLKKQNVPPPLLMAAPAFVDVLLEEGFSK